MLDVGPHGALTCFKMRKEYINGNKQYDTRATYVSGIGKTSEVGRINWKNHGPERRGSFYVGLEEV